MTKILLLALILFNAYLFVNATQDTKADLWHNTTQLIPRTVSAFSNFADSFHEVEAGG